MKQPKKPTRKQKEIIRKHHLDFRNWAVIEETDFYLKIISKSQKIKRIDKFI